MDLPELKWIATARKYIGLREVKGAKHHQQIVQWWKDIGAPWFTDDETAWCGAYVGGVLKEAGFPVLPGGKGASARAWNGYGVKLDKPAYGAIAVYWRGSPSGANGHVNFIVGRDQRGRLMGLGGNQSDSVSVAPFDTSRVLGYRWPSKYPLAERFNLPLIRTDAQSSSNEA